jgi:murein DD-endopeptidase MepM/ murein hydrolase activator NlpD
MAFRVPFARAPVVGLVALLCCCFASFAATTARSDVSSRIAAARANQQALRASAARHRAAAAALAPSVAAARRRLAVIEADVAAREGELAATQAALGAARRRLNALEARMRADDAVLARQVRAGYEGARPDAITVVLQAKGFADLLERVDFLQRVNRQDLEVMHAVQRARRQVAAAATRLGALEVRQQRLTAILLARRKELAAIHDGLAARQGAALQARDQALSDLAAVTGRLARLDRQAGAAGSGPPSAPSASPQSGHGGFVFPLPKSAASSPGSWSLDDGVDISAPGNTPLYAVGSGTVVLHGIGGFGPWAPVLHLDDGRYFYYGHAGPGNAVPVGTHVSAGQVISEVGAGIVGISTGPHLEIGFATSGGSPVGPSSASQMRDLLLGAY